MGFLEEAYSHQRTKEIAVTNLRERILNRKNFVFTGKMYSRLLQMLVRNEISDPKQLAILDALDHMYNKFYSGYEGGIAYENPTSEATQKRINEYNEKLAQDAQSPIAKVLSYHYSAISTEHRRFPRRSKWIFYGYPQVMVQFKRREDKVLAQHLLCSK